MNAVVNSQELAAELRLLNKVVPTKPAIAMLAYVMLDAHNGLLHFYATDLEVAMNTDCPAMVVEPGKVALSMVKFLALVEQFPDAPVEIRVEKRGSVTLKCQSFKTTLQTLPAEDFVQQPVAEGQHSHIDAQILRDCISRTRYAIAAAGPVSVLKGALLAMSGTSGVMVSTDTKRIALFGFPPQASSDIQVVIPAKTLDLLIAQDDAGQLEFIAGERHLFFTVGHRRITSRLIDAEFPKYKRAIPQNHDKQVLVNRTTLAAALRRVVLIAEDDQAVYLTIDQNSMTLDSASASVGSADEVVPCAYDGLPLKVCVNGGYVLDFLEVARAENVMVSFRSDKDPMMITDGPDHLCVILLIRK